jgi:arylsulfatase A
MKRIAALFLLLAAFTLSAATDRASTPNIVIVFCDDLGYADVGCFGAKGYKTPNIDRMAAEGIRFTRFYDAQPVCSASRSALMTGCYPSRIGIMGALGPNSKVGISSNEVTLAEIMKQRGYATAIYGKWHLGLTRTTCGRGILIRQTKIWRSTSAGPVIPSCV